MKTYRDSLLISRESEENLKSLSKISHMYYFENLTQQEIALKLHMSRSLVSKKLKKAKEIGLVEIIIHDEKINLYRSLEKEIENKFNIKEVICVSEDENEHDLKSNLGKNAAAYLKRVIKPYQTIGISAGTTLYQMADQFDNNCDFSTNTFIPMAGGLGKDHNDIHAQNICSILSIKTKANILKLYAPLLVDSKESKNIFLKQRYIKDVLNSAKKVDFAVLGIGGDPLKNEIMKKYFMRNKQEVEKLKKQNAIGDIGYNIIDTQGNKIKIGWNDRTLNVDINDLLESQIILVSGGNEKYEAIKAVVKNEILDVLITDNKTAEKLLSQYF